MSNHITLIKEISRKLTERKSSYGSFLIKSFVQKHSPYFKNIVTKILPIPSQDKCKNSRIWDYANFVLIEDVVTLSDIMELIDVPDNSNKIVKINQYEVEFQNENWSKVYTYDSAGGPFDFNWYCEVYRLGGKTSNISYEPLLAVDLPVFPDRRMVIKDFIGIDVDHFSEPKGIILCLPNFGARISEFKIGPSKIKVEIEEKLEKSENLIGKLYCEKDERIVKEDVFFEEGMGTIDLGFKPDYLYFVLISKSNIDIVDSRQFHKDWEQSQGVVIDIPNYQLRELISNGETDTIEFKADLGDSEEFAESVVAFCNLRGGIIILGVDDNSKIVGLKKGEYKDRVSKIIRSHVEPYPEIRFEERIVDKKRLILVFVEEGRKKPYILNDKGPFIRANGTDRSATRFEIEEFFKQRQTGFEVRY